MDSKNLSIKLHTEHTQGNAYSLVTLESSIMKSFYKIGEKVQVSDGSWNIDLDTGVKRHGVDPLFEHSFATIVSTDEPYFFFCPTSNLIVSLSLLLSFPTGEQVLCAPNCVTFYHPQI